MQRERIIDPGDQPDHETKLATLRGEDTGWDYQFQVPGVTHAAWSPDDWIRYIGVNWFRVRAKSAG